MKRRALIAVIGDGSPTGMTQEKILLSEKLGKALISNGYRIICGGLGGVMDAVARGARKSPDYRDGDIVGILPGFDPEDAADSIDIAIPTGLQYARNVVVANADAVIAIGGGAGTLSEIALAWSMNRLVIAYRVDGWSGELADRVLDKRPRYPDIPEDRIYGVSDEIEVLSILERLEKYRKRTKGIVRQSSSTRGDRDEV
jgi:uncharacterized protein (TIGR00725 family)